MAEHEEPQSYAAGEAVAALVRAYEELEAGISSMADPHQAFDNSNQLAVAMRELSDRSALLRARAVERIWTSEELTLVKLAGKIGVSKSRADQLLRAARAAKENPDV